MPKISTNKMQNHIIQLGNKLGFISKEEETLPTLNGSYSPRFDVVWYLKLPNSVKNISESELITDKQWNSYLELLPIAVFEIEGSTTSSKNQVGNFANLKMAPTIYKFAIVNNAEAQKENDTYRRGVKIYNTYRKLLGEDNIIFCDWSQIENLECSEDILSKFNVDKTHTNRSKGCGGETVSLESANKIIGILENSSLFVKTDAKPITLDWLFSQTKIYQSLVGSSNYNNFLGKEFTWIPKNKEIKKIKKVADKYYVPKLDILAGFYLPSAFSKFIKNLAKACKEDAYFYPILSYALVNKTEPIFFPLLSVEIESSVSKHLNGGILNMSNFAFMGLLVSSISGKNHLEIFKEQLGIKNVFFKEIKSFRREIK